MRKLYPDLWQTSQEKMFGMNAHGYMLTHPEGNVLFYNPHGRGDFSSISQMGGLKYHYLSHNHEINDCLPKVKREFSSHLCCHENVKPYFDASFSADVFFDSSDSQCHSNDIEVIYTPGHTNNNLCFRYRSPHGKVYLFIGDTIYQDNRAWNTLVVNGDGGDAADLKQSLLRLRGIDVDVVICNVSIGETTVPEVQESEWHSIIDRLIADL